MSRTFHSDTPSSVTWYGLEHEVAFFRDDSGEFADASNTSPEELQAIVDRLPVYEEDYPGLRRNIPMLEKRWYVEGLERFTPEGKTGIFLPKGIEIRTPPRPSIADAVAELVRSFRGLFHAARPMGFSPVWTSYHPFHAVPDEYEEDHGDGAIADGFPPAPLGPPWNAFELARFRRHPDAATEALVLYTFGPDVNISFPWLNDEALIAAAKKLTFHSPFMVPFSFSSPIAGGELWDGYSARTFVRTGNRHAARVFVDDAAALIPGNPIVVHARSPGERGRIEFKAFDTLADLSGYASLLALVKGVVLDHTLRGTADRPDKAMHRRAARRAFGDEEIAAGAARVLAAARAALADPAERAFLEPLDAMLAARRVPAMTLIERFRKTGSVAAALKGNYGEAFSLFT